MPDQPSAPLRLDAFQSERWRGNRTPVAILNTESTLHQRISYCWSLAHQLHLMSDFLSGHMSLESRQIAEFLDTHLHPLVTLLEKLGADTKESDDT
jgi:hypothetical protein